MNDSSFAQMETLLNTWGFFIEWEAMQIFALRFCQRASRFNGASG